MPSVYSVVYYITIEVWKSIFYAQWIQQWKNAQDAVRFVVQFFYTFNLIPNAY